MATVSLKQLDRESADDSANVPSIQTEEFLSPETFSVAGAAPLAIGVPLVLTNTIANAEWAAVIHALGDVSITNSGAGASLTINGLLPNPTAAITNTFVGGDITVVNEAPAVMKVNGAMVNTVDGDISVTNHGVMTLNASSFLIDEVTRTLALYNAGNGNMTLVNSGTITVNGDVWNDSVGVMALTNSGTMTIDGAIVNHGSGEIRVNNRLDLNANAKLNITGNVVNYGGGVVEINDFTRIDGHVVGENIYLSGGGTVVRGVVGNTHVDGVDPDINSITLDDVSVGVAGGNAFVAGVGSMEKTSYAGDVEISIIGNSTVHGSIYGGGVGTVTQVDGNTSVTLGENVLTRGTVNVVTVIGNVYGGGIGGILNGSVTVNMNASSTQVTVSGSIYGGAFGGTVNGNVTVTLTGSLGRVKFIALDPDSGNLYGGGLNGNVNSATTVTVTGSTVDKDVYGGGYRKDSTKTANINSSQVTLTNAVIGGSVFGGGRGGNVTTATGTQLNINGGSIGGDIYGGSSDGGTVAGKTTITIDGALTFSGVISGDGKTAGTVSGYKQLNFEDYIGAFGGTIATFNELRFTGTTNMSFTQNQDWSTIGQYTFNVQNRPSPSNPMITLKSTDIINANAKYVIQSKFQGQSSDYRYQLIAADPATLSSLVGKTFTIMSENNSLMANVTVNSDAVADESNQNVFYRVSIFNNNQLWLNQFTCGSGEVMLKWAGDYWNRYAPVKATALSVASGNTLYLGSGNTYTDYNNLTSTRGAVTLNAASATVFGGKSSGDLSGNTWINIKASSGGTVYGGGAAGTITGSTNIYAYKDGASAAPTLTTVYGGGTGGTINGGTYIDIAGATITGNIYGGGTGGTVNGGTNVIFAGLSTDLTFSGSVFGNGNGGAVNGTKSLTFGDTDNNYAVRGFAGAAGALGNFAGDFRQFDVLNVNATSAVKFTSAAAGRTFQATTWNVFGQLDGNGQTMSSLGAALNLNVKTGGKSLTQFIANTDVNATNYGTLNGITATDKNINFTDNSGVVTGALTGKTLTLVNKAAGTLTNVNVNNGAGAVTSLNLTNASSNANTLNFNGTVNAVTPGTWVTNNGSLALNNTGAFTLTGDATTAIRNNGGTLSLTNSGTGTLNYTGRWIGTATVGAPVVNSVITNTSTAANGFVWNGIWDDASKRNVAIAALTPTAGSNLSLTNGVGATMTINGAVYALSVGNFTVENRGTMKVVAYDTDSSVRSALNSVGPGGMLINNYNSLETNFIRNEWRDSSGSENAGNLTINNNAGTMLVHGRKITAADSAYLYLQEPDLTTVMTVLTGQLEAIDNVGTQATQTIANASGATFTAVGVIASLLGEKLTINNNGTMNIGDSAAIPSLNAAGLHNSLYNYKTVQGIAVNNNAGTMNLYGNVFNSGSGSITLTNQSTMTITGQIHNATNASGVGITLANNAGTMTVASDVSKIAVLNESLGSILVVNKAQLDFIGSLRNTSTASSGYGIDVDNTATNAKMTIGADLSGYAVLNDSASSIRILSTAANTLTIVGNIVNRQSGSITIANYTSILGDIIGKNITLTGTGTIDGTISGGEIQNGEDTQVQVSGGQITDSNKFVAGYTGTAQAHHTNVSVSNGAIVAAKVVGAGKGVAITGNATTTLANSSFSNQVYGGGYGAGSTVAGKNVLSLANATVTGMVFGGGANADTGSVGNTGSKIEITVTGGSCNYVYGGGENTTGGVAATTYGDVAMTVKNAGFARLYGGGYHAAVNGNTAITLGDGTTAYTLAGSIFGGGYGNSDVTGTAALIFAAQVTTTKNVWGGGRVDAGQSQTVQATSLTVNGATFGGMLYGGGSANSGGSATVNVATLTVNSGLFKTWLVGGGYATGSTAVAAVGTSNVNIAGGTFNNIITGGGYAGTTGVANVNTVNVKITGGVFQGIVFGGGFSTGGTANVGSVNMTISGGNFQNDVAGGGSGSTVANSAFSGVLNNVSITLDASANVLNFNGNDVYAGGNQHATVGGSTLITLKGDGANLQNLARIFGGSAITGKVTGNRQLKFDGFSGALAATITEINQVSLTGETAAELTGAQNLSGVNNWTLAADETPTTAMLDWGAGCVNSFAGDQITLDITKVFSQAAGYTQTLMQGASAIFSGFDSAVVSIGRWNNNVWESVTGWSVSVEAPGTPGADSIMKLAKIA